MPKTWANQVSGNLSAKPVMTRRMKLVKQNEVLPALVHRHAHHHGWMRAAPRRQLAAPDDHVVQEHGADDQHDQRHDR